MAQSYYQYLKHECGLSENTIKNYISDIKQFIKSKYHDSFNFVYIEKFLQSLKDQQYKNSSIKRKLMSIRSFMKYLSSRGIIDNEEIDKINTTDSVPFNNKKFITESYFNSLFNEPRTSHINDLRDNAIILLIYDSGLRSSEICNLTIENINLHNKTIRIMGKGSKERISHLTTKNLYLLKLIIDNRKTGKIFKNISRHIIYNIILRRFNYRVNPQDLRRSFAKKLLNRGISIRDIQYILGHEDLSTTQHYLPY